MKRYELDQILFLLERHQQAATYAAIAEMVGGTPRGVMAARERSPRNSWAVAKKSQRPTGYPPSMFHSDLCASIEARGVIATGEELKKWLAVHT